MSTKIYQFFNFVFNHVMFLFSLICHCSALDTKVKQNVVTKMLDDTSDIPTFRPSDIVECSTPIRLSDTSSQNSLDDEMDLTMISLSSSSANDTTQVRNPRAQNETVKTKKVCASDVGNNNYSQLEPLDISDDSIDANDVQEVNTLTEENAVEKSPKIRQLKVVLYKMSPDYIQAMLNGVKFTQPARGAIKRNERPKTKSKETNKKSDQTFDADVNYKDWQWQPNLKLRRLKEIDVEKFKMSRSRVSPIEFDDSDESIIRELSPKKATILFERVRQTENYFEWLNTYSIG